MERHLLLCYFALAILGKIAGGKTFFSLLCLYIKKKEVLSVRIDNLRANMRIDNLHFASNSLSIFK